MHGSVDSVCCYLPPAGNAQTTAALLPHLDLSDEIHLTLKKKKRERERDNTKPQAPVTEINRNLTLSSTRWKGNHM